MGMTKSAAEIMSGIDETAFSRKLPEEHGTPRGFNRHRTDRTPICRSCREAENERRKKYGRAWQRALSELRRRHAAEFAEILEIERSV